MNLAKNILELLRTWHRQQAGELLQRLGVSRQSLMRAIKELNGQVVSGGRARRTAYAARRPIRGSALPLPLYRIDEAGQSHEVGTLEPIYPEGCALRFKEKLVWPLDADMVDGWFTGVPYFLGDMRPQGFLGRNFAHQISAMLQVDQDVKRWSEDDVLHTLSMLGWDQPGNFILGEPALRRFLEHKQAEISFLSDADVLVTYPEYAKQALNFGLAGSSAAGEFPKFLARRVLNGQQHHVIVKFSGADGAPQEQRWADLLVCEHLALTTITDTLNLPAAQSRIQQCGGRTFFEVERFDRHGAYGRSGVCSWFELNAALFGLSASWSEGAEAMHQGGFINAESAQQVSLLEHFGRLIANTDMHDGNLAFVPSVVPPLALAPAYDMLPMLYAPQSGVELVARKFAPALPLPRELDRWVLAAKAASIFWRRAAQDTRISTGFRAICQSNTEHVEHLIAFTFPNYPSKSPPD